MTSKDAPMSEPTKKKNSCELEKNWNKVGAIWLQMLTRKWSQNKKKPNALNKKEIIECTLGINNAQQDSMKI